MHSLTERRRMCQRLQMEEAHKGERCAGLLKVKASWREKAKMAAAEQLQDNVFGDEDDSVSVRNKLKIFL